MNQFLNGSEKAPEINRLRRLSESDCEAIPGKVRSGFPSGITSFKLPSNSSKSAKWFSVRNCATSYSVENDRADAFAGMHQFEALVDVLERHRVG
ncbi:hypothetical protein, partial [Ensifer sp. MJa1]|uniref:hypothetical protein n=1 Tax=Ensifer sp. MJa1 TaxID=2919888 RepID=UPI003008D723